MATVTRSTQTTVATSTVPVDDLLESSILRDKSRLCVLPIPPKNMPFWDFYKKQRACGWEPEEVILTEDTVHWQTRLTKNEQHFIERVLAFFAVSDGIVLENLIGQFSAEVPALEVQYNYIYQAQIEQVHAEVYARFIDAFIEDDAKKNRLFDATTSMPCVARKGDWARKWMDKECASFGVRLVAFAAVEGILFSGSFCAIYWLKERGLMPGLSHANELIARDEGMHTDFAVLINKHLAPSERATEKQAHEVIGEAVQVEKGFIIEALPASLIGMNNKLMSEYIEFVADRLLLQLGHAPLFNASNPFDFMERISLRSKQNFFEKQVANYGKAFVGQTDEDCIFDIGCTF